MPGRKCKFFQECKKDAVTYISFSKMPLCKEHYLRYIENRIKKNIESNKLINFSDANEKILVALSGGKDSSSLLTMLDHVIQKKIPMEALYIQLGISPLQYSQDSEVVAKQLCTDLSIPLNIVDVKKEYGFNIDDIHEIGQTLFRHKDDTKYGHFRGECSYCGLLKRYAINRFAIQNKFTKVATGHNLTDECTALMSNFFSVDVELMARAGPVTVTDVDMLVPRIKPMYYIYERETILYAYYANIPHIATECAYSQDSPMLRVKRSMEQIEEFRRGNMMNLMMKYQKTLKPLLFATIPEYKKVENTCSTCGMATYLERCSFCKTRDRVLEQLEQIKEFKVKKTENSSMFP